MKRILMMTGNKLRHQYVATQFARSQHIELVGIVSEAKAALVSPKRQTELTSEDDQVINRHFQERDQVELQLLGALSGFPDVDMLTVPNKESNSDETYKWITTRQPDYIVLYGTSIIKPPLLTAYEGRMVNIHLGLSPYYRGSGTNFWPLVHGKPECVGATVHLAVLKVDAGAILAQIRPDVFIGDRSHHMGTRVIMRAAEVLPEILFKYDEGKLTPQTQDLSVGEVYRRRDFTADSVRRLWENLDGDMISEYVKHKEQRDAAYPIVNFPP